MGGSFGDNGYRWRRSLAVPEPLHSVRSERTTRRDQAGSGLCEFPPPPVLPIKFPCGIWGLAFLLGVVARLLQILSQLITLRFAEQAREEFEQASEAGIGTQLFRPGEWAGRG